MFYEIHVVCFGGSKVSKSMMFYKEIYGKMTVPKNSFVWGGTSMEAVSPTNLEYFGPRSMDQWQHARQPPQVTTKENTDN